MHVCAYADCVALSQRRKPGHVFKSVSGVSVSDGGVDEWMLTEALHLTLFAVVIFRFSSQPKGL